MTRYQFARAVRAPELLAELAAAGLAPTLPDATPRLVARADVCWVECAPEEFGVAATVVAAHDAAAYDAADAQRQQQVADALAFLKQFRTLASGSATNTQRDNAIKSLSVLLRQLYRELN